MAIRIRVVDGVTVALCAARSIAKPGDIYLDDAVHESLADKFTRDWYERNKIDSTPFINSELWSKSLALVEQEESNNPNRDEWDKTFGNLQ
jgi:hypothetical protein